MASRRVPSEVKSWADHDPVIGGGSIWTLQSAALGFPQFDGTDGIYRTKIGWYLRPAIGEVPQINGRRVDRQGDFQADADPAHSASGTWVASVLQFSSAGCWEVTARYRSSTLKFHIDIPPSRACTDAIVSGANAQDIPRHPTDLVLGPVRFPRLLEGRGPKAWAQVPVHDRTMKTLKVPLAISGTPLPSIVVRVGTHSDSIGVLFDAATIDALNTGSLDQPPAAVSLQSGIFCGHGTAGFVQYAGGFVARHPACAVLEVLTPDGQSLGKSRVGFQRPC